MTSELRDVRICEIRQDTTQTRAEFNKEAIENYADLLGAGVKLPPADVFYDGETYWCGDGFHRLSAASNIGWDAYPSNVFKGGERQAMLHSLGSNHKHGIRRTNKDKRNAIRLALADTELRDWSNRRLADYLQVDDHSVASAREAIEPSRNSAPDEKRIGKDGKRQATRKQVASVPVDEAQPTDQVNVELAKAAEEEGPDFDPVSLDQQPEREPEKPKKPGKPTIDRKTRTLAQKTLGALIRVLSTIGIYDEFAEVLSQVAERLKTI